MFKKKTINFTTANVLMALISFHSKCINILPQQKFIFNFKTHFLFLNIVVQYKNNLINMSPNYNFTSTVHVYGRRCVAINDDRLNRQLLTKSLAECGVVGDGKFIFGTGLG